MPNNDRSYMDENLSEQEKDSGRTRLPAPETEGNGGEKSAAPVPTEDKESETLNPQRDDEFGDGDRRS